MRKLILAAAILAPTLAQAGYYNRVPNGSEYHYIPSPEEQAQAYRQQQLQREYQAERLAESQAREQARQRQEMQNQIDALRANQNSMRNRW